MKKVCCMVALAAICFSSVYANGSAVSTPVKNGIAQQDTVKKKVKEKNGKTKKKVKTKRDSTKTNM